MTQKTIAAPLPQQSSAREPVIRNYAGSPGTTWTVGTLVYTTGGLALLFFWLLLGDFALSVRDRSVGPIVQLFLKREGISDTAMALMMTSLPPLLGLIISPIVSYRSDRLRSRWGRRIPFLIIPTPIAAVAMIGIALTPWLAGTLHAALGERYSQATCTLVVFGLFWTLFEVAVIVSQSVFGGLVNDVVPRPVLGRFFALFRAVSLIDGMLFNYFLIEHAETHFTIMFVAVAAVFGVGFILMCLMVKEGEYPVPPEKIGDSPEPRGFQHVARLYFRECYCHSHYRWCFVAFTAGAITFLPVNSFNLRYAKDLHIEMSDYGKLVMISYFVSLLLAWPLGVLVDRFHPLRVALLTMFLNIFSAAWGAIFITDATSFSIAFVAHNILSGAYITTAASLGQRLLPRSKFTQFASAGGILTALATMCIGPLMGQILDHTHHHYRLTFTASFMLASISTAFLLIVYRKFMALGGPASYHVPDSESRL